MKRLYENILVGLIPIYRENIGDCTEILVQDRNNFILNYKLATIIKALEKYYMINLKESKRVYSKFINAKNLVPIPFDQNNIFIPIKIRTPRFKNDPAFGYINLKSIAEIIDKDGGTEIKFKNGELIQCLANINTVKKHIHNGNIIKNCFVKREMKDYKENYKYSSLTPASKEDINKLINIICEFENTYLKN